MIATAGNANSLMRRFHTRIPPLCFRTAASMAPVIEDSLGFYTNDPALRSFCVSSITVVSCHEAVGGGGGEGGGEENGYLGN